MLADIRSAALVLDQAFALLRKHLKQQAMTIIVMPCIFLAFTLFLTPPMMIIAAWLVDIMDNAATYPVMVCFLVLQLCILQIYSNLSLDEIIKSEFGVGITGLATFRKARGLRQILLTIIMTYVSTFFGIVLTIFTASLFGQIVTTLVFAVFYGFIVLMIPFTVYRKAIGKLSQRVSIQFIIVLMLEKTIILLYFIITSAITSAIVNIMIIRFYNTTFLHNTLFIVGLVQILSFISYAMIVQILNTLFEHLYFLKLYKSAQGITLQERITAIQQQYLEPEALQQV